MKEYVVEGPSGPYSVQLSDEEAKARGLTPRAAAAPKAKQPANKQASPENKASGSDRRAEAVSRAMNKPTKANG